MTFQFDLGALAALEAEDAKPKETAGNVLIIDDEPENLFALERILSAEYKVFATTSQKEALQFVRDERIDVILTDQRMPGMLGTELLKEVKDENDDNVRMILTGYTDVKDLIDCINSGLIYRYLVKPWNADEITGVVRQAMDVISQRRTMNRMVPNQVVERLYPNGMQGVTEGFGKQVECAIMFLDIRGFTSLAESMDGQDAFQLLTSFIRAVGPIVSDNHGFIDKYLGDGLLAIFDRADEFPNDVLRCINELAAKIIQYNDEHRSPEIPETREDDELRVPLRYGVGVSYGQVILGTVGFKDRIDFTVLGDAVNTASRIESMTKELGTGILIHSKILEKTSLKDVPSRAIGDVPLRGKKDLTPLSELLVGESQDVVQQRVDVEGLLKLGVAALNESDNELAQKHLKEAQAKSPQDGVVEYFLRLAEGRSRSEYSRSADR